MANKTALYQGRVRLFRNLSRLLFFTSSWLQINSTYPPFTGYFENTWEHNWLALQAEDWHKVANVCLKAHSNIKYGLYPNLIQCLAHIWSAIRASCWISRETTKQTLASDLSVEREIILLRVNNPVFLLNMFWSLLSKVTVTGVHRH